MKQEYVKLLTEVVTKIANTDHIKPGEIPNIDLYMDQVTSFMDEHLKQSKRFEDDKILTKTMINNYTKNKLLPAPNKKRYSSEHMLVLIFIYYFKAFLSLGDVQSILQPMTEIFFQTEGSFDMDDIYEGVYELGKEHMADTTRDILDSFHLAANSFKDCPEDNRDLVQLFSFICMLSLDIYLKKEVIQKMIDGLPEVWCKNSSKEKGISDHGKEDRKKGKSKTDTKNV